MRIQCVLDVVELRTAKFCVSGGLLLGTPRQYLGVNRVYEYPMCQGLCDVVKQLDSLVREQIPITHPMKRILCDCSVLMDSGITPGMGVHIPCGRAMAFRVTVVRGRV